MASTTKKGIFFAITAYACYATAACLIKLITASSELIVFSRNLIGLCVFLPLFFKNKDQLKTSNFWLHCIRSIISLATIYCSTYGIQRLKLADAILLEQTAPFFILAILFILKKESISLMNLICICGGFLGACLILTPSGQLDNTGSFASLGAGLLIAVSIILMKRLSKTESTYGTLFYFLLLSSILSAVPAMRKWEALPPLSVIFFLFLIGLFFSLFQLFLTRALTYINARVAGSYACLGIVFSFAFGSLFLNEELTLTRLLGATLIITAGLFIYHSETKQAKHLNF